MAGAGRHAAPRTPPAVTEAIHAAGVITASLAVVGVLTVLGGGPGPAGGTSSDGSPGGSRPDTPVTAVGSGGATPTTVVAPGATGGPASRRPASPPPVSPPPGVPTGPTTDVAGPGSPEDRVIPGTAGSRDDDAATAGQHDDDARTLDHARTVDHATAHRATHDPPDAPGADPDGAAGQAREVVRHPDADRDLRSVSHADGEESVWARRCWTAYWHPTGSSPRGDRPDN